MRRTLLWVLCCLLLASVCSGSLAEETAACEHLQTSMEHVGGLVYKVCDACGAREEYSRCVDCDCDIDGYCDVCGMYIGLSYFREALYASPEKAAEAFREMLRARESGKEVYFEVTREEYEDESENNYTKFRYRVFRHTGAFYEGDYLDESFVISSFGTSRVTCGGRYFLGFKVGQIVYGTTAEQEAAFNAKIVEIINANGWAALSGYDQVKAVYDWVCANVAYDHEHFDACDSFSHLDDLTVPLQESYLPHTAYNGLFAGKCVCSGYTQLLYAFYSKLGVDCRIISGSAGGGPHAWNIVCLDGLYYFVDATWDAELAQSGQEYAYFLRSEANMTNHFSDSVLLGAYEISDYDYGYTQSDADEILESGTMGNVEWKLTGDGTLTFAGRGAIHRNPVSDKALIRSVVIGDGITSIGTIDYDTWSAGTSEAIFKSCTNLQSVTFGKGLTLIGDETFTWCTALTEAVIPDNVTQIGYAAFSHCESLASVSLPANITVLHVNVFVSCSKLTEVQIPDSVTTIGGTAFNYRTALTSVTLPAGLTQMGTGVFEECTALTSIAIPAGVKSLGYRMFFNCTSLKEVTLCEGLTELGEAVFYHCESLTQLDVPDSLTTVGSYCFGGSGITRFDLPETMTEVPRNIFDGCSALESVTIPSGVTKIDDYAFAGCSSLNGVILPDGLISIGYNAFSRCSSLTELDLPAGLTSIGENAFSSCTALTGVTIPAGVKTLGDWVFYYCTSLTRVDGMEGVTSIGKKAFYRCRQMTDFVMPAGVRSIGAEAFSGCTSLSSISIPHGVTAIGERVFYTCSGLTSVTLPSTLTSIGAYAFYSCGALKEITIPAGVTEVGRGAFVVCYNLVIRCYEGSAADVYAQEEGLKVAYITADSIEYDVLPADLVEIGAEAFLNCQLGSVRLPEGVTTIGSAAFKGASLTYIFIPATAVTIAEDAFEGCTGMAIVGVAGSYAQEYAQAHGFAFIAQE